MNRNGRTGIRLVSSLLLAFGLAFFGGATQARAKHHPTPTPTATPAPEARALFERAQESFRAKRYKESRDRLLELIAKFPVEEIVPKSKVLLAEMEEDFEASLKELKDLAKEYKKRPEGRSALLDLIRRYYLADRYEEAAESGREFLKRYPGVPEEGEVRYWLGSSLLASDHLTDAVAEFNKALKNGDSGSWAAPTRLALGGAYLKQREYDLARRQFLRILDQYPRYGEMNQVLLKLGRSYEALDQPREARAAYLTLLERYPRSLEIAEAKERVATLEHDHPELRNQVHETWATPGAAPTAAVPEAAKVPAEAPPPGRTSVTGKSPMTPATPRASAKPFRVQVGVYTVKAFAEDTMKRLKKAGYTPTLLTVPGRGAADPTYKVRAGHYADREEAKRAANLLQRRLKLPTLVVEEP